MTIQLRTGRGVYRLTAAAPPAISDQTTTLTLALERADGIERVTLRCCIAQDLLGAGAESDDLLKRLGPWIERDFEQIREAALKTIRTERRLLELALDEHNRGPF